MIPSDGPRGGERGGDERGVQQEEEPMVRRRPSGAPQDERRDQPRRPARPRRAATAAAGRGCARLTVIQGSS